MDELVRKELVHTYPGMKKEDFLAAIDATGGWPIGYTHVSFYHAADYSGRYCKFTDHDLHTGWWTTVCTADDYYWWKISDAKKSAELKKARRQLIDQLR